MDIANFRNVYISAVTNAHENEMVAVAAGRRKKRMSDPNGQQLLDDTGAIFVTTSDGRYRRKVRAGLIGTNLELTCQKYFKEKNIHTLSQPKISTL
jgi:hypothetical protein